MEINLLNLLIVVQQIKTFEDMHHKHYHHLEDMRHKHYHHLEDMRHKHYHHLVKLAVGQFLQCQ